MMLLRAACWASPKHRAHVRELRQRRDLIVHLGCGNALIEGWVNVDCYPPVPVPGAEILTIDMRHGLPFADASARAVFSEHFLEHLPHGVVAESVLPEIRRILAPGGVVRISVPNGEFFIEQYTAARLGRGDAVYESNRGGKSPMRMFNDVAHGYGHQYLYDYDELRQLMEACGFVDIRRAQFGDSSLVEFRDKDRDDDWRIAMSLYVEACAPSR